MILLPTFFFFKLISLMDGEAFSKQYCCTLQNAYLYFILIAMSFFLILMDGILASLENKIHLELVIKLLPDSF